MWACSGGGRQLHHAGYSHGSYSHASYSHASGRQLDDASCSNDLRQRRRGAGALTEERARDDACDWRPLLCAWPKRRLVLEHQWQQAPRAPGASRRRRAQAPAGARGSALHWCSRRLPIHGAEAGFRPVDAAEALAAIHGGAAAQGCSNRAESRRRAPRLDDSAKCAPLRLSDSAIR